MEVWYLFVSVLFIILQVIISNFPESVYSYRGGYQRKIILTVEQNRDQHYKMVLWGAGAAWCPQLQRRKGKTFIGCYCRISLMPLTASKGSTGHVFYSGLLEKVIFWNRFLTILIYLEVMPSVTCQHQCAYFTTLRRHEYSQIWI